MFCPDSRGSAKKLGVVTLLTLLAKGSCTVGHKVGQTLIL